MNDYILKLSGITKSFGETLAVNDVNFDLRRGEVHALVGENGAGKSTLMKIAAGIHHPDSGQIYLDGKQMIFRNPREAFQSGIAMVHQELSLAKDLSVAENIFAAGSPIKGRFVNWQELNKYASDMLADFNLNIAPNEVISNLNLGSRQVVEILKALAIDPKVIIFDEPTSSLEANESKLVIDTIRKLAGKGIGVVYISHRMDEVFQSADRITVLRDGALVSTLTVSETNRDDVVNMMVGRELTDLYPPKSDNIGDELLRVENLCREDCFSDINFSLKKGEILGFSGLVGSGRTEVMRSIFHADRYDSGSIFFNGKPIDIASVKNAMDMGIAYLPEDRKTIGLFLDRSIEDNILSANLDKCSSGIIMESDMSANLAQTYCDKLNIKCRSIEQDAGSLSGGNQQKILFARWLASEPKILIVDEPTRGVDIGAKSEIHKMLRDYASEGNAVIVVSSEMQEIIGLCDRIIVMHEGRITGEVSGVSATEEQLIQLAVN